MVAAPPQANAWHAAAAVALDDVDAAHDGVPPLMARSATPRTMAISWCKAASNRWASSSGGRQVPAWPRGTPRSRRRTSSWPVPGSGCRLPCPGRCGHTHRAQRPLTLKNGGWVLMPWPSSALACNAAAAPPRRRRSRLRPSDPGLPRHWPSRRCQCRPWRQPCRLRPCRRPRQRKVGQRAHRQVQTPAPARLRTASTSMPCSSAICTNGSGTPASCDARKRRCPQTISCPATAAGRGVAAGIEQRRHDGPYHDGLDDALGLDVGGQLFNGGEGAPRVEGLSCRRSSGRRVRMPSAVLLGAGAWFMLPRYFTRHRRQRRGQDAGGQLFAVLLAPADHALGLARVRSTLMPGAVSSSSKMRL